jgi:hypothetical protein
MCSSLDPGVRREDDSCVLAGKTILAVFAGKTILAFSPARRFFVLAGTMIL